MAETPSKKKSELMRSRALHAAARLFLSQGYTPTTLREIAAASDMNIGSLVHLFGSKENLLSELVSFVLEGQFAAADKLVESATTDKLLLWAAETTLQLHMAESDEHVRELYIAAYSLPATSDIIHRSIAKKMMVHFAELHPDFEEKDFYEIEIASGGIMRGFLSVPCDMYFTIDRKVHRFLETAFLVYRVPDEKIEEAIAFVRRFDFAAAAEQTINSMLAFLGDTEENGDHHKAER